MGLEHYQTVDPPKESLLHVGRGLYGVHLPVLYFKFNFPNPSNLQHIFLNLTYPLRKRYLFPKIPKNHPKIYKKLPNSG